MTLQEFTKAFASQFEETDPSSIKEDTDFKQLDEWDSLIALSVIALADEEFGVKLTGDDIKKATSVANLFEKIKTLK